MRRIISAVAGLAMLVSVSGCFMPDHSSCVAGCAVAGGIVGGAVGLAATAPTFWSFAWWTVPVGVAVGSVLGFGLGEIMCPPDQVQVITYAQPPVPPEPVAAATPEPVPVAPPELDPVYFDFNRANIRPSAAQTLNGDAEKLANAPYAVNVVGNCDSRGGESYNLHLGQRRAESTIQYLEKFNLPSAKFIPLSNGRDRPVATIALQSGGKKIAELT